MPPSEANPIDAAQAVRNIAISQGANVARKHAQQTMPPCRYHKIADNISESVTPFKHKYVLSFKPISSVLLADRIILSHNVPCLLLKRGRRVFRRTYEDIMPRIAGSIEKLNTDSLHLIINHTHVSIRPSDGIAEYEGYHANIMDGTVPLSFSILEKTPLSYCCRAGFNYHALAHALYTNIRYEYRPNSLAQYYEFSIGVSRLIVGDRVLILDSVNNIDDARKVFLSILDIDVPAGIYCSLPDSVSPNHMEPAGGPTMCNNANVFYKTPMQSSPETWIGIPNEVTAKYMPAVALSDDEDSIEYPPDSGIRYKQPVVLKKRRVHGHYPLVPTSNTDVRFRNDRTKSKLPRPIVDILGYMSHLSTALNLRCSMHRKTPTIIYTACENCFSECVLSHAIVNKYSKVLYTLDLSTDIAIVEYDMQSYIYNASLEHLLNQTPVSRATKLRCPIDDKLLEYRIHHDYHMLGRTVVKDEENKNNKGENNKEHAHWFMKPFVVDPDGTDIIYIEKSFHLEYQAPCMQTEVHPRFTPQINVTDTEYTIL